MVLLGMIARSLLKVRISVERQFVSTTCPSNVPSTMIQLPARNGFEIFNDDEPEEVWCPRRGSGRSGTRHEDNDAEHDEGRDDAQEACRTAPAESELCRQETAGKQNAGND